MQEPLHHPCLVITLGDDVVGKTVHGYFEAVHLAISGCTTWNETIFLGSIAFAGLRGWCMAVEPIGSRPTGIVRLDGHIR